MSQPVRHGIRMHPPSGSIRPSVPEKLADLLARFYQLGDIIAYQRVSRGQVNTGHIVEIRLDRKRSKFFIREYHPDRKIMEIEFEHALINHLVAKKFQYVGRVIPATNGQTYVRLPVNREKAGEAEIFAVFDYLPGQVRYDWTPPACDSQALESAAMTLARYHQAVTGWHPVNALAGSGIVEHLAHTDEKLHAYNHIAGDTRFDTCLRNNLDLISRTSGAVLKTFRTPAYDRLPRLAIHGDFHPGNLTFKQNRVSGLFDFDWARMDARCFDVALAVFYFCTRWQAHKDGRLDMDRVAVFVETYQKTMEADRDGKILSRLEQRFLPDMIMAADIYVLGWILSDFYSGRIETGPYTGYLRHGVNFMRWAEENSDQQFWQDIFSKGDAA